MKLRNPIGRLRIIPGARLLAGALLAAALTLPAGAVTVQGTVYYEKIPATLDGLDLEHPVKAPAGFVRVELRTPDQKKVLAKGVTGDDGRYRLDVADGTAQVVLVAWAQSGKIHVEDPATRYLYGVVWTAFDPAKAPSWFLIPDKDRLSGPFNLLATIGRGNRFLKQIDSGLPIEQMQLTVFWSPTNEEGSYFQPRQNAAWIQGVREEDSDEFDDSVILHEYGHYLAHRFSRDENPGGPHWLVDRVDPRLAWSEGWATFFAQAVLGTPVFINTTAPGDGWGFDLEEESPEWEKTPGYWSEFTVGAVLWAIYSDRDAGREHLGQGLQPIWQVMRQYFPRQVFPYLITLADGLIQGDGSLDEGVTALLARRDVQYRFGVVPPVAPAFPRLISTGVPATGSVDSKRSRRDNLLESADYYLFRIESERQVDLQLRVTRASRSKAADLELVLYDEEGEFVAQVDDQHGVGSLERVTRTLGPGTYVIGVWSYRWIRSGNDWDERYDGGEYELTATF